MIKSVETAVSLFMQMAVVCTFGLSLAIGVAGVSKVKSPFGCVDCSALAAVLVEQPAG